MHLGNKELLEKLEGTHVLMAQAILELRDLVNREADFTVEAKQRAQDKVDGLVSNILEKINELI